MGYILEELQVGDLDQSHITKVGIKHFNMSGVYNSVDHHSIEP